VLKSSRRSYTRPAQSYNHELSPLPHPSLQLLLSPALSTRPHSLHGLAYLRIAFHYPCSVSSANALPPLKPFTVLFLSQLDFNLDLSLTALPASSPIGSITSFPILLDTPPLPTYVPPPITPPSKPAASTAATTLWLSPRISSTSSPRFLPQHVTLSLPRRDEPSISLPQRHFDLRAGSVAIARRRGRLG
jgi:hypothetical protein